MTTDIALTQSLDLGFLDNFDPLNMPESEFIEEMVPVDSFFNSYVEGLELGARGASFTGQLARMDTGDGALPPALSLPQIGDNLPPVPLNTGLPGSVPQSSSSGASSGMNGHANGIPTPLPELTPPALAPTSSAASQPPPATAGTPQSPTPAPQAPAAKASTMRGGHSTRGAARGTTRSLAASSEEALHHLLDHEKTKRNPKQQLQNKQAQQRYRERRKQRFQELETSLGQMTEQMQAKQYEIAGLQSQNAVLQGKAQQLSDALAAKDSELAALKAQLAAASGGGSATEEGHSSGTGHDSQGGKVRDVAQHIVTPEETTTARTPRAVGGTARGAAGSTMTQEELRACREQYDALVSAMRELADVNGLREANPLGEGVAPAVLEQVKGLVGSGCRASQDLERGGGIRVLEVMGRDVEKLGGHSCATERARWLRILEALRLVPRQEEALLALRKQHLAKLKQVYHTRQSLNMQAMGMMLPTPARSDTAARIAGADPTLEGKMACMSIGSYLDCAHNTLQLDSVLDSLKENLRDEQRAFLELKLIVLHRVLSPIQTLLFVIEAYPTRPDALALANSVALKLGRAAEGCPKAAALLKAVSADMEAERKASGGSSGVSLPARSGSLEGTDDSHKSDCSSLNQSRSGGMGSHV